MCQTCRHSIARVNILNTYLLNHNSIELNNSPATPSHTMCAVRRTHINEQNHRGKLMTFHFSLLFLGCFIIYSYYSTQHTHHKRKQNQFRCFGNQYLVHERTHMSMKRSSYKFYIYTSFSFITNHPYSMLSYFHFIYLYYSNSDDENDDWINTAHVCSCVCFCLFPYLQKAFIHLNNIFDNCLVLHCKRMWNIMLVCDKSKDRK